MTVTGDNMRRLFLAIIFLFFAVDAFALCSDYSGLTFCDDFEGRATGQTEINPANYRWQYNWQVHSTTNWPTYPTNATGSVQINGSEYYDGTRSLEIYQQDASLNGQGRAWLGDDTSIGSEWSEWTEANLNDEYYARIYIKFSSGTTWQPTDNRHHLFMLFNGLFTSPTQTDLTFYLDYDVSGSRRLDVMVYSYSEYVVDSTGELKLNNVTWDGNYKGLDHETGTSTLQDNTWYKVDFYIKWNTFTASVSNNDGIFQMWVDDVLYHNYSQCTLRSSLHQTIGLKVIGPGPNTPDSFITTDQKIYYDDIMVSETQINTNGGTSFSAGSGSTAITAGSGSTTIQ